MLLMGSKFAFTVALGGLLAISLGSWAQTPQFQEKASSVGSPEVDAPANGFTITYKNGELGIVARNTTLSDLLHAVSARIGASLDIPPGADEPLPAFFGHGNVSDILSSMLGGSRFNYLLVGSPDDEGSVTQILLYPLTAAVAAREEKSAGQPAATAQIAAQRPAAGLTATPAPQAPKERALQATENNDQVKAAMDVLKAELPESTLAAVSSADNARSDVETTIPLGQTPVAQGLREHHGHRHRR